MVSKGIKTFLLFITAILVFFWILSPAEARQGCCSHHNGVCGCSCCDGTALSDTCAPYYPECNGGSNNQAPPTNNNTQYSAPVVQLDYPTWTVYPTSTLKPTRTPTPTVTLTPTISPTVEASPTIPIPSPSISISISISFPSNTQKGGIGGFFSSLLRGIYNILTLNIFNRHIQSPVPPSPTITPSIEPSPTITPTPTIKITFGLQLKTTNCKPDALPDKLCTPGDVIKDATKEQICVSGYTKKVRNVSQILKNKVFAEYGIINHPSGDYEVDHLIPLELGGSNDISNLWPETAEPRPGYHEKDKVENFLHSQVCNGFTTLDQAQLLIVSDWLEVLNQTTNR